MFDIQSFVLCPFSCVEYWRKDPQLNGVPIPGLLYADNLVLFCLSADLLRERLCRVCAYADANMLTVNVSKCEVVFFGKSAQPLTFKYKWEVIPVRRACKYLGVWLDGALNGKVLADAVVLQFLGSCPGVFRFLLPPALGKTGPCTPSGKLAGVLSSLRLQIPIQVGGD
jgi:hypothetical protein